MLWYPGYITAETSIEFYYSMINNQGVKYDVENDEQHQRRRGRRCITIGTGYGSDDKPKYHEWNHEKGADSDNVGRHDPAGRTWHPRNSAGRRMNNLGCAFISVQMNYTLFVLTCMIRTYHA